MAAETSTLVIVSAAGATIVKLLDVLFKRRALKSKEKKETEQTLREIDKREIDITVSEGRDIRRELRQEVGRLQGEINRFNTELDEWRQKYYTNVAATLEINSQYASLQIEHKELKADYSELSTEYHKLKKGYLKIQKFLTELSRLHPDIEVPDFDSEIDEDEENTDET